MKINSVVKLCALTAAICAANASYAAGPQTATVTIHATVAPTCSISATSLEFNNYDPTSTTDKTGTGTVTLTCVKGKHILHKHLDTDTKRDTRPYLKLAANRPNSILVGASKVAKNNTMKQQMLNRFKTELFDTYLNSFSKINEEYKKINSGRELETLVIVPIPGLPGVLTEVESEVLATAVLAIQNENPDLKIHVSAAETLHENRIRSAYEEKIKDST